MAKLLENPLLEALEGVDRILLAGCGGGYDVFSGLPLYFALKQAGKTVFLSNFTFTPELLLMKGNWITRSCLEVTADTTYQGANFGIDKTIYFPELYLSQWFRRSEGEEVSIYTITNDVGIEQTGAAYRKLVKTLQLEAIILCDGGTDSLMKGDEISLGTPTEDSLNLIAVSSLPFNGENGSKTTLKVSLLANIGMGVDTFHGVLHSLYLENVAHLMKKFSPLPSYLSKNKINNKNNINNNNNKNDNININNEDNKNEEENNNNNNENDNNEKIIKEKERKEVGFRGCFSLLPHMEEAQKFIAAYEACNPSSSIVCSSIASAVAGEFGNFHSPHTVRRTSNSALFISPFVVGEMKYKGLLEGTKSIYEVSKVVHGFHDSVVAGKFKSIPVRKGAHSIPY